MKRRESSKILLNFERMQNWKSRLAGMKFRLWCSVLQTVFPVQM